MISHHTSVIDKDKLDDEYRKKSSDDDSRDDDGDSDSDGENNPPSWTAMCDGCDSRIHSEAAMGLCITCVNEDN